MKKKVLFYIPVMVFASLFCFSCSSDSDDPVITPPSKGPIVEEDPSLTIYVKKNAVNVFEMAEVGVANIIHPNGGYDSIVWDMSDVYHHVSGLNSSYLRSIGNGFYLPGEYKVTILGYKDKAVISGDSAVITVKPIDGNFMGITWNDPDTPKKFFNFTSNKFYLNLTYSEQDAPRAVIEYRTEEDIIDNNLAELEAKGLPFFHEYISAIYGKSIYSNEKENENFLIAEYSKRFKTPLNAVLWNSNYIPVEIWVTGTTHIALMKTIKSEATYYCVIAEPRKF